MNYIKNIMFAMAALLVLQACDPEEFLNIPPKDQITELKTDANFRTYAWKFYGAFPGYSESLPNSEWNADLFLHSVPSGESNWIWQRIIVPSSSGDWSGPYAQIRNINIMLDALESAQLTEQEKNHWKAVGYFFRAYQYTDLINKYGDVPLITKALTDADEEELFSSRTPRDEVAQKVLDDLLFAEANINPAGDGPNTINPSVVQALISRFGLVEGTWRKYHDLGSAEQYLRASIAASEKLMAAFPSLHPNYDEVFNSLSLANVPGIILYKQYEDNQIMHGLSYLPRTSSGRWDLTKKAAGMYLMTDGQSIHTSPLFDGDKNPYDEFRNRDKRLYYTVPPPYKVITAGNTSTTYEFTPDPADREYFPVMAAISDKNHKELPTMNWNGFVIKQEPHFADDAKGQPFSVTYTGYRFYKFTNLYLYVQSRDINDAPIFRMGEVLLNYAEARYELSEFDQTVADNTINKLRARGGVAALSLAAIPEDPTRDPAVNPALWEIRRERAVELMGEGFRFDDLRRWKKMDYAAEQKLGRWIKRSEVANVPILGGAAEGYVAYFGDPPPFPDYYYLYPIPSDQIVLNPKLEQNPGWTK